MRDALRLAARRWRDEADPARQQAETDARARTGFSPTQIAFALNEQMAALARWLDAPEGEGAPAAPLPPVALHTESGQPLAGLAPAAVLLAWNAEVDVAEADNTHLTRAFLRSAGWTPPRTAPALQLAQTPDGDDVPEGARVLPWRAAAALLDGRENADALERLAEDVLLYDGATPRCVRILWAPRGLPPDACLAAFAQYRARFPAPEGLRARVRMMTAFAQKGGLPAAFLDDHSLLVTRGAPDVQRPGHVRWAEYSSLDDVRAWAAGQGASLFVRKGLDAGAAAHPLGTAHRPGTRRFTDAARVLAGVLPPGA